MEVSRQADPRANQKLRTRTALIEAGSALLSEGTLPTIADVAERALVSRATAYRYFPTQDSLLLEVTQIEPLVKPVETLIADGFTSNDVQERLAEVIGLFMRIALEQETVLRTAVRAYQDAWLAHQSGSEEMPMRSARRVRWLDEILRPIREQLSSETGKRLRIALTLTMGGEALITMKDVGGLSDDDEIIESLQWAASALLRAALEEAT